MIQASSAPMLVMSANRAKSSLPKLILVQRSALQELRSAAKLFGGAFGVIVE
jgi:hypothetical protein